MRGVGEVERVSMKIYFALRCVLQTVLHIAGRFLNLIFFYSVASVGILEPIILNKKRIFLYCKLVVGFKQFLSLCL